MKLQTLHEAKHHIDQRERFLNKYFNLADRETETHKGNKYIYEMWYPKKGFLVTVLGDTDSELSIWCLTCGKENDKAWTHEVTPMGWNDPIELHEGLQELRVWRKEV